MVDGDIFYVVLFEIDGIIVIILLICQCLFLDGIVEGNYVYNFWLSVLIFLVILVIGVDSVVVRWFCVCVGEFVFGVNIWGGVWVSKYKDVGQCIFGIVFVVESGIVVFCVVIIDKDGSDGVV